MADLREPLQLLQKAYSILETDSIEQHAAALRTARDKTSASRFSTDPDVILQAAVEGRVEQIYLDEGAAKLGVLECATYESWDKRIF